MRAPSAAMALAAGTSRCVFSNSGEPVQQQREARLLGAIHALFCEKYVERLVTKARWNQGPTKPGAGQEVSLALCSTKERSRMSNPNQNQNNQGQQNQTPGQKPGQQQGGGQKPGQQTQDPSRQGQTPNPGKDR